MSLLSICQNAANDLGVTAPTSIFNNTDPAARRLLQLARREGANLSTRTNWAAMVVQHVFVANGTSDYQLPADFRSMINDTLWDRSRYWQMRGAMTPQQWQLYRSSIIGRATIERRWRIRVPTGDPAGAAAQFSIDPPITDTTNVFVYEYASKNWAVSATNLELSNAAPAAAGTGYVVGDTVVPAGGTFTTQASLVVTALANTTTGTVSELEVITPGVYTVAPTNPVSQQSTTGSGTGLTMTLSFSGATQSDWRADTDTSLLDEDLIELGVIWRLARRLGLAYDEERAEYQNQVGQAVARDGGTQTLRLAPVDRLTLVGPYNVQEGNFPGA